MKLHNHLLLLAFLVITGSVVTAQEPWVVPENKSTIRSPFTFDEGSVEAGKDQYVKACASCHGDPGKGNFQMLVPPPPDLSVDAVQKQTDGDLFYKISNGRGLMPKFKDVITDEAKWQVIAYIRSFNPGYVQDTSVLDLSSAMPAMKINLKMYSTDSTLFVEATSVDKESVSPVAGLEIAVFARRAFGSLQLGEAELTDSAGKAKFTFDFQTPGDTLGNLVLTARVTDADNYGDVLVTETLPLGKVTIPENILEENHMWGTRAKTPVWVYLSYSIGVIGVWSFLMYVVFLVWKIRKAGKN